MEKATAEKIMAVLLDGTQIGALDILSFEITNEAESHAFRRQLAGIMAIYTDLVVSIAHQYPELDPDKPSVGESDSFPP